MKTKTIKIEYKHRNYDTFGDPTIFECKTKKVKSDTYSSKDVHKELIYSKKDSR